jgi:hypothetical protein
LLLFFEKREVEEGLAPGFAVAAALAAAAAAAIAAVEPPDDFSMIGS